MFKGLSILLVSIFFTELAGQDNISDLGNADSLQNATVPIDFTKRRKVFLTSVITGYTLMSTGLYFAWYDQFEQTSFHLFDDAKEWKGMDKAGHVYSAYLQSHLIYEVSRWAGYEEDQALLLSGGASILGQLTIEVMDGFSAGWGFSLADMGANLAGTGLYYVQQRTWGEQRLRMKMSYWPIDHTEDLIFANDGMASTTEVTRADILFGGRGVEKFLKDYNGQTLWLSMDLSSFLSKGVWPKWLNLAVGYSAENLYGGFNNAWVENGNRFTHNNEKRAGQLVLALDYNLSSIRSKNQFGKSLLKILDIFKWPAPGVSYDKNNGVRFHLVFRN